MSGSSDVRRLHDLPLSARVGPRLDDDRRAAYPADTEIATFTYGRKADSYIWKAFSVDGSSPGSHEGGACVWPTNPVSSSSPRSRILDDRGQVGTGDPDRVRVHEVPTGALVPVAGGGEGGRGIRGSAPRSGWEVRASEPIFGTSTTDVPRSTPRSSSPLGGGDSSRVTRIRRRPSKRSVGHRGGDSVSINARSGMSRWVTVKMAVRDKDDNSRPLRDRRFSDRGSRGSSLGRGAKRRLASRARSGQLSLVALARRLLVEWQPSVLSTYTGGPLACGTRGRKGAEFRTGAPQGLGEPVSSGAASTLSNEGQRGRHSRECGPARRASWSRGDRQWSCSRIGDSSGGASRGTRRGSQVGPHTPASGGMHARAPRTSRAD